MWLKISISPDNLDLSRHRGVSLILIIALVTLLTSQAPTYGQGTPIKDKTHRDFDNNCMRSGCHGGLNETAWVHGPVAVGSCDICHKESGPAKDHKFTLLREKEKVCTYCHQGNVTGKVVHKIVTKEGCLKCHNPHGGVKRNLLLVQDEFKLCTECHKPQFYSGKPQKLADLKPTVKEPVETTLTDAQPTDKPLAETTSPVTTTPETTIGKAVIAQTAMVPLVQGLKEAEIKKMDLRKFQFVHKPITEGKCLSCHDAHSSNHKGLLPVPEKELCITCHKDWNQFKEAGLKIHTPAEKDCLSCHMKHGGNVEKLLVRQPKDLCLSCHTHVDTFIKSGTAYQVKMVPDTEPESKDPTPKPDGDGQAKVPTEKPAEPAESEVAATVAETPATPTPGEPEKPVTVAADDKGLLPGVKPAGKDVKETEKPPVKMKAIYVGEGQKLHKGIKDAKSCLLCHEHHAANSKVLVHADIKKPCLSCHNEDIKVDEKTVITNIKKEIDSAKFVHGPVADGKCLHCHKGHSSAHRDLLTQGHTDQLYTEYSKTSYDLCFTCHDRRIAEDKETMTTNFRDKTNNLHYLHIRDEGINTGSVVGKKKVKGRTCNVCHDMHAGPQKSLIRPDLPYGTGGWKLKIQFTPTKTGGSCLVACHKKKSYTHAESPENVDDSWKARVKKQMTEKGLR